MAIVPAGLVRQKELAKSVDRAIARLGNRIVHLSYSLGEDWTGEPSVFFRVVIPDAAAQEDKLVDVTNGIRSVVDDIVRPFENWGLLSYFSFRSKSEQNSRNDPEWA
ncbi:MAG TPA: hypothetical protein VMF91_23405 [Bryobacteraceae bacterium]|nr:hypothetical protein [Bryobacteraceae bacterium]